MLNVEGGGRGFDDEAMFKNVERKSEIWNAREIMNVVVSHIIRQT